MSGPDEVCAICGWARKRHELDNGGNPRCPGLSPRFLSMSDFAKMLKQEKSKCD